jgi:Carboxypeptidase regulatory-like domain
MTISTRRWPLSVEELPTKRLSIARPSITYAMIETRTPARWGWMLGIALIALAGYAMNGEPTSQSGIEGSVRVGPIHGGPTKLGEPDSAPLANATFQVESAAGTIKTFTTDEHGHFKVDLPPGRYAISTERTGMKGRGCGLKDIEVTAAGFKQVTLECDTGMR